MSDKSLGQERRENFHNENTDLCTVHSAFAALKFQTVLSFVPHYLQLDYRTNPPYAMAYGYDTHRHSSWLSNAKLCATASEREKVDMKRFELETAPVMVDVNSTNLDKAGRGDAYQCPSMLPDITNHQYSRSVIINAARLLSTALSGESLTAQYSLFPSLSYRMTHPICSFSHLPSTVCTTGGVSLPTLHLTSRKAHTG